MKYTIIALFLMATSLTMAQNDTITKTLNNYTGQRPDGHAPISVMGDHTHGKGELLVSYRFMSMQMEDILIDDNETKSESLLKSNGGNFMVTPLNMPMQMHMIGLMYAPTNKLTLFVMGNYVAMEMEHKTAMNTFFTTESSGFGDTKVGLLYNVFKKRRSKIHANFLVSLPTGSIEQKDKTPASNDKDIILPYPMQIGSGTVDFETGFTYLTQGENWSFGSQLNGLFRVNENNRGYTLGNRYSFNNWFAVKATNFLSISARLEGLEIKSIKSADSSLNPNMIITANTDNTGGTFVNSGLGINTFVTKGSLKGLRLGAEYAFPLYQKVNGIQLQPLEVVTLGLQYAF